MENKISLVVVPDKDDIFKYVKDKSLEKLLYKYKTKYNARIYSWSRYPLQAISKDNVGFIIAMDNDEAKSILPKMLGEVIPYDALGDPSGIMLYCHTDGYKEFIYDISHPCNKNEESNNIQEDNDKLFGWSIPNPHFNCKYTQARKRGIVTGVIWAKNKQDAKDKILAKFSSSNYDVDGLIYTEDINLMEFEEITEEFQIIGDYEE